LSTYRFLTLESAIVILITLEIVIWLATL